LSEPLKNGLKALKSNSVVQRATSKLKLEIALKEQKKMEDKDSKKRYFSREHHVK